MLIFTCSRCCRPAACNWTKLRLRSVWHNTDLFFITDVIGVCKSVDEMTRLTTKTNREVSKRALSLMDMSGKLVTVTLWGEEASKDL